MTKLPPKALTTIRNMRAQISSYLQGVIDGMGVKGPMQLNEETGELTPIVTAPAKENDGKKQDAREDAHADEGQAHDARYAA